MRITQNTNFETVRDSIFQSREKMENLQQQAATARKINKPSDDPIASSQIMELRTNQRNDRQYELNSHLAQAFLSHTDEVLSDLSDIVLSCKEIAMTQSSVPSSTVGTRLALAEELSQLYSQALSVVNRRLGDRYLLSGFKTQLPPVNEAGVYQGDSGEMFVEIGDHVFIAMNLTGKEVLTASPFKGGELIGLDVAMESNDSIYLFKELEELRMGLLKGQFEVIRSKLENFDEFFDHLVALRSKIGSRIQGIQSAGQATAKHQVMTASLDSFLQDADMAQVMTELNKEEVVFRSALASAQRLIQPNLMDFLK